MFDTGLPFAWEQGQHISLIGDTGTGKTTLAEALLSERDYVLVLRSKPDDVRWPTYKRVRRILPTMDTLTVQRLVLEPRFDDQPYEFAVALDRAFQQGGWTVFIDDLPHVQEMSREHMRLIKRLLIMGRSVKNSVLTAMQRPVDVTRYAIGESRLTVSFMLEGRDVDLVRQSTSVLMSEAVARLGEHDVAIFHRPTRAVWSGILDLGSRSFVGRVLEPRSRAGLSVI